MTQNNLKNLKKETFTLTNQNARLGLGEVTQKGTHAGMLVRVCYTKAQHKSDGCK